MIPRIQALTGRFDPDDFHGKVLHKGIKETDGIRPAPNRRHHIIREPAFFLQDLGSGFPADDRLKMADHQGVGMGPHRRPKQVKAVGVPGEIHECLVHRFFQRAVPGRGGDDLGPEQLHAEDVERLALHIQFAHKNQTFQSHERRGGGGGHSVLPGPGFGDDLLLPEAFRQQDLAQGVVDLVGSGVVQVFPLEVDLGSAHLVRQSLGEIQGIGPARIVLVIGLELGVEFRVVFVTGKGVGHLVQRLLKRRRHKTPSESLIPFTEYASFLVHFKNAQRLSPPLRSSFRRALSASWSYGIRLTLGLSVVLR